VALGSALRVTTDTLIRESVAARRALSSATEDVRLLHRLPLADQTPHPYHAIINAVIMTTRCANIVSQQAAQDESDNEHYTQSTMLFLWRASSLAVFRRRLKDFLFRKS